eukprot:3709697-Rhodomonas_salina.1
MVLRDVQYRPCVMSGTDPAYATTSDDSRPAPALAPDARNQIDFRASANSNRLFFPAQSNATQRARGNGAGPKRRSTPYSLHRSESIRLRLARGTKCRGIRVFGFDFTVFSSGILSPARVEYESLLSGRVRVLLLILRVALARRLTLDPNLQT